MVSFLYRLLLALLYVASLCVLAYLAYLGKDYYLTPLAQRPRHPLYWTLKPGGELGLLYGIAGASMMVLMLLYTVRKRVPWLRRLGSLRVWLDLHIFLGILGPLFILLHTSFKVGGLVAVSFWSMVAVAASGVLGRYLYLQVPRSHAGDELTLSQAEALDEDLSRRLREVFGLPEPALERLKEISEEGLDPSLGLLPLLGKMMRDALAFRFRLRRFRRQCREVPRPLMRQFLRALRQKAFLRRRLLLWRRLHEIFHYWHVIHKPFALVMYLFLAVHVAVAWMTGYAGGWG